MLAQKRLQRELMALQKERPPHVRAVPTENNILVWHFVLEGPADSPFAGGLYHGKVTFPSEYPHKPPSFSMFTPSGRFQPNSAICVSFSNFHPESWNPVWSVATMLSGLLSFMLEPSNGSVGSIDTDTTAKRRFAIESLDFNLKNKEFCKLFPELVELAAKRKAGVAAPAASSSSSSSSTTATGGASSGAAAAPVATGVAKPATTAVPRPAAASAAGAAPATVAAGAAKPAGAPAAPAVAVPPPAAGGGGMGKGTIIVIAVAVIAVILAYLNGANGGSSSKSGGGGGKRTGPR